MRVSDHGGDIYSPRNRDALDFSANINPLGLPDEVKQALAACADFCGFYPDPLCRGLVEKLAEHEGVNPSTILCGNGAADLIYRMAYGLKYQNALLLAPTFSEYESALMNTGCRIAFYPLQESRNFLVDEDILESIQERCIIFLCNPNNPTGALTDMGLMKKILMKAEKTGSMLIVDECFNSFVDFPERNTMKEWVGRYRNLMILKAFTKNYAMAGLRLGYVLCSDRALLDALYATGPPWSVSVTAQRCGIAALTAGDYVSRSREIVKAQRTFISEALKEMGLRVYPGAANYVLFRCNAEHFAEKLLEKKIIIRNCGNYRQLDHTYYRTAVRTAEENEKLIAAIREVIG